MTRVDATTPTAASDNRRLSKPVRAGLALTLLALANAFNLADRSLIGVVQEPLKTEFALSDLQLGLLGGPAFAILYSLLSIPIARFADRGNRITILSASLAAWSVLTALCGFAGGYLQLLLLRAGVSIGEAGGTAPAVSYLSEVSREKARATALAVFSVGAPAGAIVATVVGGFCAQHYGWRIAFVVIGAPGLLLALAVRLLLREVRTAPATPTDAGYVETLRVLVRKPTFVSICVANVFAAFALNAIGQYLASFLIRAHDMSLAAAAGILGTSAGVFGTLGAFLGGVVADRAARHDPGMRTKVIAAAFLIAAIAFLLAWWVPLMPAVVLIIVAVFTANAFPAVSYAVASGVSPVAQRTTAVAVLTLASNLLGYALGPPLVGMISDAIAHHAMISAGIDPTACIRQATACRPAQALGVREALSVGSLALFGAAFFQWRASRTLATDLEADQAG